MATNSERSVTYKILDHIGVLATYKNNWSKELNLIQWNDRSPKFDIRDWDAEHEHIDVYKRQVNSLLWTIILTSWWMMRKQEL